MLQIVGALILLIAGFAILRLLFRALTSTASALAGFVLLCLFGPALLAGYITERITRLPWASIRRRRNNETFPDAGSRQH
ncbi:hypothetical protein RZD26_002929 [Escherichia coli]|nr:hypothetical protein [Escherichia coli]